MAFELSIYLLIAIICLAFLLLSLVFGDLLDLDMDVDVDMDIGTDFGSFGGPGISPLSLPILLTFGGSFGVFGSILEALEVFSSLVIPIISAILAALMSGGVYWLFANVLLKNQVATQVTKADLIGEVGRVTVPIEPESLGQVLVLTEARGRTLLDAVASEEIHRDASVKIIAFEGNSVRVEKIGE